MSLDVDFFLIATQDQSYELAEVLLKLDLAAHKSVSERQHYEGAGPFVVVLRELFLGLNFLNGVLDHAEYVNHVVFVSDGEFKLLYGFAHVKQDFQVFLDYPVFVTQSFNCFLVRRHIRPLLLFQCVVLVFEEIEVLHLFSFRYLLLSKSTRRRNHRVVSRWFLRKYVVLLLEVVDAIGVRLARVLLLAEVFDGLLARAEFFHVVFEEVV
jgi:hypothetical protein